MKKAILLIFLFSIQFCSFAQKKKHGIESEILTAYPIISLLGPSTYNQFNPNVFYTYQFKPKYKLVVGLAYHNNKFESPCPSNYCSGFETNEMTISLGLRRDLWTLSENAGIYGEYNLNFTLLNNSHWGAGGFSGLRTDYTQNGFGLGSTFRLGYSYNISSSINVSLNSALNISSQWVEQRSTTNSQPTEIIKQVSALQFGTNILALRLGYRF